MVQRCPKCPHAESNALRRYWEIVMMMNNSVLPMDNNRQVHHGKTTGESA